MTDFRQKAAECYAEYRQSRDPAEAAAADAYNEAADEIERLAKENAQLKDRIELLEHEMKYGEDD